MVLQPLEQELAIEQAHMDRVLDQLRLAVASAKGLAKESRARFTSDRETWVREEDGTALFERDAFAFVAARRMADLDSEHEGLVFGRLDFIDEETRYVGRLGVRTAEYEPLVLDWRASAAEPFYRATPANPMDVVRRRVLTSRNDRVMNVEDDILMPETVPADMAVIGDGALMRALGRARDTKMHDIVATIQLEQDEAIRADYPGFTLITGGPGTGKTVVGLHRVAYLLYTYRRRFGNGGVLIIGPSTTFIDYIERVLPSLGEDKVVLRSLGHVATDTLSTSSSIRGDEAAWVVKGSTQMASVLRRLVEFPLSPPEKLTVMVKGDPITLSERELAHIRKNALGTAGYHEAKKHAERAILDALWGREDQRMSRGEFDDRVRDSWAFVRMMDSWWPDLTAQQVLGRLSDAAIASTVAADSLTPEQISTLSSSINPGEWTIADIPLLDELAHVLGKANVREDSEELFTDSIDEVVTISERLVDKRNIPQESLHDTYAHILVDEAQDITPMQWRMIHRRGSGASWTILGDPAQSNWPDPDEPLRVLRGLIGAKPRRSFRLSTNYRSPKEAYDLATAYIREHESDADIPTAVRSTGIEPRLQVVPRGELTERLRASVDSLMEEVEGTIGVIAQHEHGQAVFEALLGVEPRVISLDPMGAKGLEFDAVIVVDPDSIQASCEGGSRTLYVALTRPTQILVALDLDNEGSWRPSEPTRPPTSA